ncbi:MAG: sodium:calcium antiporter [Nitrospinae bacterium]|nr:sodium:calcium antiporter [Nitrospinota bacterium]
MIIEIAWLVGSLIVILLGCELFTNGIEWTGKKLQLSEGLVGSVLAAVGTALPETLIPIIAIIFSGDVSSVQVGIGAIAGAPFMLSTLAFFVSGVAVVTYAVMKKRDSGLKINSKVITTDLLFFLIIYTVAIGVSFLHSRLINIIVACMLTLSYGYYLWLTLQHEGVISHELEALHFSKNNSKPRLRIIAAQVFTGLAFIVIGAHFFVESIIDTAKLFSISPLILSLLLTPVATELPEKMNSVLWLAKGRDTMAIGNITGAMVFQGSFPVAFGMAFTPWHISESTLVSALLAILSSLYFYIMLKKNGGLHFRDLLLGGGAYAGFIVYVFFAA